MLPAGITGFGDWKNGPIPQRDPKQFKQLCYGVARKQGGRVVSFDLELAGKNFYAACIETNYGSFYLLENAFWPWAALAQSIEAPAIVFSDSRFDLPAPEIRLLTPAELGEELHGSLDPLGEAEREQIRYWNPRTVGEVVFNFWD